MTTRAPLDAFESTLATGSPPRHGLLVSRERIVEAESLAICSDGIVSRAELRRLGIERGDVARELAHGRWVQLGRHSVAVHRGPLSERGLWRHALHEVGSHGALEGTSALKAAGLTGYIDRPCVSVLHGWQPVRIPGVLVKELRGGESRTSSTQVFGEPSPRLLRYGLQPGHGRTVLPR